jgi:dUTP pyrophosphatase
MSADVDGSPSACGETVKLLVKRLSPTATLPAYSHPGDAGLDLCADVAVSLGPGESKLVGTGISIELPPNTEAQVRPRSGLALKHGITVLNTPGTIDHGYRGEVGVILINHGRAPFDVQPGMKIAQMVIAPFVTVGVEETGELSGTSRGQGGFGSTGV